MNNSLMRANNEHQANSAAVKPDLDLLENNPGCSAYITDSLASNSDC